MFCNFDLRAQVNPSNYDSPQWFKVAFVDRNPSIALATLVKRWVNEAQEAVKAKLSLTFFGSSSGDGYHGFGGSSSQPNRPQAIASSNYITQYHGLGLFYLIRQ